ncbi:hypothetical protein SAMN05216327_12023 [Dyadobacter sp. SG02]|nr:hypothetical protein SAMN05216327_12023 [Dyadobacter sp. SG02]
MSFWESPSNPSFLRPICLTQFCVSVLAAVPTAWFANDEWLNIFVYKIDNGPVSLNFGLLLPLCWQGS